MSAKFPTTTVGLACKTTACQVTLSYDAYSENNGSGRDDER